MMGWECQEGHFHVEFIDDLGWHLDPIKIWHGYCILCNCNCNRCFGWRRVGLMNVMGDNMFVLDIKFCEIIILGVIFGAIMCNRKLWFPIASSPRHVSMVSWTWDNMSEDSFLWQLHVNIDVNVNMYWRCRGCLHERIGHAIEVKMDGYCKDYF